LRDNLVVANSFQREPDSTSLENALACLSIFAYLGGLGADWCHWAPRLAHLKGEALIEGVPGRCKTQLGRRFVVAYVIADQGASDTELHV
jgi:hypothetical protein